MRLVPEVLPVPATPMASGVRRPGFKARFGPAGLHLFNRATGANVLLDEVVVPEVRWAIAPRFVSIALTNACDLHCAYCYAPKHAASADLKRLTKLLLELDDLGCLGVGFGGGEPTLWRELPRLCEFVAESTNLAVTLTTHGHRFDDVLARALRGKVHFIRVSVDGLGSTYEALRGRSFAELQRRIAIIRSTAPFGINLVVNRQTLPDLAAVAVFARDVGAVELLLLPEQPVNGRGGIDSEAMQRLGEWAHSGSAGVRLATSDSAASQLPTCDPLAAEAGLRAYAHIDASGNLKASSYAAAGVPTARTDFKTAMQRLARLAEEKHEGMEQLRLRTLHESRDDRHVQRGRDS